MLGVFAAFETAIGRERQMQGIAKAKAEGAFKGRKPSIDATRVRELAASGMGETAIAKELRVSRASVYRLIGRNRTTVVAIARPTSCLFRKAFVPPRHLKEFNPTDLALK